MVVTVLVLLFALWMSCKKSRAIRSLVSVVFLVFDLALYFLAIFAFVKQSAIAESLARVWECTDLEEVAAALGQNFNYDGWDVPARAGWPSCKSVIEPQLTKHWKAGAGALLAMASLLTIGVVLAFKVSCSTDKYRRITDVDTLHSQPDIGEGLPAEPRTDYTNSW
jgi:hypothetical protein